MRILSKIKLSIVGTAVLLAACSTESPTTTTTTTPVTPLTVTNPPVVNPPEVTPPVLNPPVVNPPVVNPPVVNPPVVNPPVVNPPVVNPPVVNPPVVNPPVVNPPVVNPPVVNPPVTDDNSAAIQMYGKIANLFGRNAVIFSLTGDTTRYFFDMTFGTAELQQFEDGDYYVSGEGALSIQQGEGELSGSGNRPIFCISLEQGYACVMTISGDATVNLYFEEFSPTNDSSSSLSATAGGTMVFCQSTEESSSCVNRLFDNPDGAALIGKVREGFAFAGRDSESDVDAIIDFSADYSMAYTAQGLPSRADAYVEVELTNPLAIESLESLNEISSVQ